MSEYLLFVDDSGTREYAEDRVYRADGKGKSLYFVYGAVLLTQQEASKFVPRLQSLKQLRFGTSSVEIKSNWLRIPKERQARYIQPFSITDDDLDAFTDEYYKLIAFADVQLLGSVVNKLHMQQGYVEPWYAPTMAYECLMQRAALAVGTASTLAVTVDDISGKTPKQSDYKRLLSKHHERLRAHGSILQKAISFQCLTPNVRFMPSEDSDLVQVADVVSYCVHRQFRDHGEAWETKPADQKFKLPMYQYFQRIAGKFRTDGSGRIQGFGIAKAPLKNQVQWRRVK